MVAILVQKKLLGEEFLFQSNDLLRMLKMVGHQVVTPNGNDKKQKVTFLLGTEGGDRASCEDRIINKLSRAEEIAPRLSSVLQVGGLYLSPEIHMIP